LKTKHKIAVAKLLYRTISTGRHALGRSDRIVTTKGGLTYELDLSEGIDLAMYLFGGFEPSTRAALAKCVRPGMTALDIGANVGSHTLHLANLVGANGRVYAFEPTDFAYAKLVRNLSLNPILARRVVTQQCFLTSTNADEMPQEIWSSWPLAAGRDLHPVHLGAKKSTAGARARTLDSILADDGNPAVDVVKMDVDGAECAVLSGASRTMSINKPIFVMEWTPYTLQEHGRSFEEMMSFFVPLGYRFFHQATGRELPSDSTKVARMIGRGGSINVIARAGCI
jgi:FkbM family methyltransferase